MNADLKAWKVLINIKCRRLLEIKIKQKRLKTMNNDNEKNYTKPPETTKEKPPGIWVWMKKVGEKRIYDEELNVAVLKESLRVTSIIKTSNRVILSTGSQERGQRFHEVQKMIHVLKKHLRKKCV